MVKDCATNGEHLLSGWPGPAHTGASESGLELLDFTLNRARANGIAFLAESLVLHPSLNGMEVTGMVGYPGLVKRSGNMVDAPLKEVVSSALKPVLGGGLILRVKGIGSLD